MPRFFRYVDLIDTTLELSEKEGFLMSLFIILHNWIIIIPSTKTLVIFAEVVARFREIVSDPVTFFRLILLLVSK